MITSKDFINVIYYLSVPTQGGKEMIYSFLNVLV